MKQVTIDQVMDWEPCGWNSNGYTVEWVTELFAGRETLTAADIAALDIPKEDILWALLHNEFLTDEQMHLLACDYAEAIVHLCGDDPRPQAAIDAKRAWVRGEINDGELAAACDAARAASWAAARAAACDAARDAARDASWAAARAAARDASWAASWAAARAASWAAAWAAACDAAWDAAGAAAGAAARAAARDASWAAAWDATRDAQIARAVEVIET